MSNKIMVLLVDDHPLFREGVAQTLQAESDIEVVGQAASAEEAVRLAATRLPDVVLLDIGIPGGGMEAAQRIAATCPVSRIAVLTASEDEDDLLQALKVGAKAYVLKGVGGRELVQIVRAVWAGEAYVSPALASSLLFELTNGRNARPSANNPFDDLTDRERQILEGVAAGHSNKEIGHQLGLSEKTVKHYMTNVLQKLHVRNRVEAALLAQKRSAKRPEA